MANDVQLCKSKELCYGTKLCYGVSKLKITRIYKHLDFQCQRVIALPPSSGGTRVLYMGWPGGGHCYFWGYTHTHTHTVEVIGSLCL